MNVRMACDKDIPKILDLLKQVDLVHHIGRPDIFKIGTKYNAQEIKEIFNNEQTPILVCVDESDVVLGYCFCIYKKVKNDSVLTDIKTLYIDDLCVDENIRGKGIGRILLEAAKKFAKETGCYNVTLNVWSCNQGALKFYEACGLIPQKVVMETIL